MEIGKEDRCLLNSDRRITVIAYECGFADAVHFIRDFKTRLRYTVDYQLIFFLSAQPPIKSDSRSKTHITKKTSTMAQQNRAHIVLASLTLAGGLRYPSALGHLIRTASIAAYLASVMELDDAEQQSIYLTAPVHDVGKLGIPDDVLLKPASLTEDEHKVMQRHSSIGADLLAGSADTLLRLAADVARHHHEHYDGDGYPAGLAGENIPLSARVVAIADAFDAMVETRVYREGMKEEDAHRAIEERSGQYFDPSLVALFLKQASGIQRVRAAAEDLVSRYGMVSAVTRFYGVRGHSPAFFEHIRALT